MKAFYIFIFSLLFSLSSFSQQPFAPPGAVWHYDYWSISGGGFIKIEYHTDSIIQGVPCKKLEMVRYLWYATGPGTLALSITQLFPKFVYQNGDTVFWFSQSNFRVLYNFNAASADLWTVTDSMSFGMSTCDSLSIVHVDSTGSENISSENLRYLSVHPEGASPLGFYGRIYERFGSMQFLFPEYTNCDSGIIVDGPMYHLHCYEDSSFQLFNADTNDCEFWFVLAAKELSRSSSPILISPNPATDKVFIQSGNSFIKSFYISDITGKNILMNNSDNLTKQLQVDVSSFTKGIYFIHISSYQSEIVKKFVKM